MKALRCVLVLLFLGTSLPRTQAHVCNHQPPKDHEVCQQTAVRAVMQIVCFDFRSVACILSLITYFVNEVWVSLCALKSTMTKASTSCLKTNSPWLMYEGVNWMNCQHNLNVIAFQNTVLPQALDYWRRALLVKPLAVPIRLTRFVLTNFSCLSLTQRLKLQEMSRQQGFLSKRRRWVKPFALHRDLRKRHNLWRSGSSRGTSWRE